MFLINTKMYPFIAAMGKLIFIFPVSHTFRTRAFFEICSRILEKYVFQERDMDKRICINVIISSYVN